MKNLIYSTLAALALYACPAFAQDKICITTPIIDQDCTILKKIPKRQPYFNLEKPSKTVEPKVVVRFPLIEIFQQKPSIEGIIQDTEVRREKDKLILTYSPNQEKTEYSNTWQDFQFMDNRFPGLEYQETRTIPFIVIEFGK